MQNMEEKHTKYGGETSQRLFLKYQNWAVFGFTAWKFLKFVFSVCPCQGLRKFIETKVQTNRFYLL